MLAHLGRRLATIGTLLGVWGWVVRAGLNGVHVKVLIISCISQAYRAQLHFHKSVVYFGRAGGSGRDSLAPKRHLARSLTSISQTPHFYQPGRLSPRPNPFEPYEPPGPLAAINHNVKSTLPHTCCSMLTREHRGNRRH